MHATAEVNASFFYDVYISPITHNKKNITIVEIGSQTCGRALRDFAPKEVNYIGLDFEKAAGVDVVLTDPYKYPIEDNSVDIVVSSSCFEHAEFFWLSFLEIMRILKPTGLFYLNVPSSGGFHRYPVDCWRFYPDSGQALSNWANRNGFNCGVLESYITVTGDPGEANDFVAVFLKDISNKELYQETIVKSKLFDYNSAFKNAHIYGEDKIINLGL